MLIWSHMLTVMALACILAEWLVVELPRGERFTLSVIVIVLALLFSSDTNTPQEQAVGALEVIAIGSLVGYGLGRREPVLRSAFYVAHYIWASSLAGLTFVIVSEHTPRWFVAGFHVSAVAAYTVVFSLTSMLLVSLYNARVIKGKKLPKADLLYTLFLAPIALIVYYFFKSRDLSLGALFILIVPLVGVLMTFRWYVNIDTMHTEIKQLYSISRELVASMSREETVQKVSESIARAISQLVSQLDACLVYAGNEESNEFVLVNPSEQVKAPLVIVPGHGLLGRAALKSDGDVIDDVSHEQDLTPEEQEWGPKTAVLVHPMVAEREVGLLVLVRRDKGFTAEEFRLVGIVAGQAGITLHNAQMYEQSLQLAERDRQLDLLNQTAFLQRARRILGRARIDNQPVALLLGDIDDFRRVNNTYGHQTGDVVLAGVARLMKQVVGDAGIVGRWGGEEFVVLLPNVDDQEAMEIAERIRQSVQDYVFESDGHQVRATISTGVALFPRDAGDITKLVKQADRAAYLAKRLGKNRVCLYEDRKEVLEGAL